MDDNQKLIERVRSLAIDALADETETVTLDVGEIDRLLVLARQNLAAQNGSTSHNWTSPRGIIICQRCGKRWENDLADQQACPGPRRAAVGDAQAGQSDQTEHMTGATNPDPERSGLAAPGSDNGHKWIKRAQNWVCPICGVPLPKATGPTQSDFPTLEHVFPRCEGGSNEVGNLLVTHRGCNEAKRGRLPMGCEIIWLTAVNARLGILR